MCGIAGIIYADANGGREVGTRHHADAAVDEAPRPRLDGLRALRPAHSSYVMRFTLADANDPRDFEFADRIQHNRFLVEQRLRRFGAQSTRSTRRPSTRTA